VPKGQDIPYVLEGSKIYLRKESETDLAMRDEIVAIVKRSLGSASPSTNKPRPAATAKRPQRQQPSRRRSAPAASKPAQSQPAEPSAPIAVAAETPSDLAPRTGVEIVESVERKGTLYHTMRDLRDNDEVHNVSRASARRLWRYAIALKEKSTFHSDKVTWKDNLGLWHKYMRSGRPNYDLVQRLPNGDVRIYYGVTEDGIHGPWRAVVGLEDGQ